MTLTDVDVGKIGKISGINGDQSDPVARRLSDLGFLSATDVEVMRRSPFGDPTVYRLRGYEICLRSDQANRVDVVRGEDVLS